MFDGGQRGRSAVISVFANQTVDGGIFAEFLDAGRENDELCVVSQGHARSIDGFIAQPRAVKLVRIEIDNSLLNRLFEHFEIDLETEVGSKMKTLGLVADVEAAHGD